MPSPDHLMGVLTRPQLLGWMVWASIRGPIGPTRRDYYVKYLAEHADPAVSQPEFDFPWVLPDAELARLRAGGDRGHTGSAR